MDIVLRTRTTLYVVELKLEKNADDAMQQIDLKNYTERFKLCELPVVKVNTHLSIQASILETCKNKIV